MNIGIIGCGLIGTKRASALDKEDTLVACCDTNLDTATDFAQKFCCRPFRNHRDLITNGDCDIVIVAVVNKYLKDIVIDALKQNKHVVAEKPLGRNVAEAESMVRAAAESRTVLKTGFNHRYHPAIREAKRLCDDGRIGDCLTVRARYGHGSRPGMEKEWRSSKELCGGGELLDQGVHVIDLIRWFAGEIKEVYGKAETLFWNINVEDNAFAILKTDRGVRSSFHVSWTNWRNVFSFEVSGTKGYLSVQGLGGSYGPETLEVGIRKEEGGRPDIELIEYSGADESWSREWGDFRAAILEHREPLGSGNDGLMANRVVEALYQSSQTNCVVRL
jgi:predicted dehydrogenase